MKLNGIHWSYWRNTNNRPLIVENWGHLVGQWTVGQQTGTNTSVLIPMLHPKHYQIPMLSYQNFTKYTRQMVTEEKDSHHSIKEFYLTLEIIHHFAKLRLRFLLTTSHHIFGVQDQNRVNKHLDKKSNQIYSVHGHQETRDVLFTLLELQRI